MFKTKFLILLALSLWNLQVLSQKWTIVQKNQDSVFFKASQILVTSDTFFISATDSFIILKKAEKYRIKENPYSESEVFYDSLQVKSYKNRITRELYQLFIKSRPIEVKDTSNFDKSESVFLQFQGLRIRNIHLLKVDVIEGSIHDTSIVAHSFWVKSANNVRIKTRDYIIYNNLTIKEGDFIDAINLADNERILRSSPYIEDARIQIIPILSDTTEVDLLILTKDKFPVGIGFDYSGIQNFQVYLYNKNFIGIGHDIRHYLIYRTGYDPQIGYAFKYRVNNIFNSFITLNLNYENSWERQYKGFSVNRNFLTQQTKFGGGISLYKIADNREYINNDSTIIVPYETVNHDYWLGNSLILDKTKGTIFNTSIRFANANFIKRPFVSTDSNYFYHDRNLILVSFSLIQQKYYLSNLTYGFGITEDIPYGYKLSCTMGHEKDQFFNRSYLGGAFSYAKYYKYPGYMSFNAEFGSFLGEGETQDRILKFKLSNIGNLHKLNHYSIRNFFDFDFQSGYNMSDPGYKAVINGRWTSIVSGLKKEGLKGRQKITASYQSVLFTPWYLFGFKFAMLGYVDLGWVSQDNLFKSSSFYGNLGLGVRIKNESWVFETITLGFAYFLNAPTGSDRMGFIFDGSDPRLFRNLNPGKPDVVRMDQSPTLFVE